MTTLLPIIVLLSVALVVSSVWTARALRRGRGRKRGFAYKVTRMRIFASTILALCLTGHAARAEPPLSRHDDQRVYVMYPDTWWGRWLGPSKVGISNDADRRRSTFATAHYNGIVVYATFPARDARSLEDAAHDFLQPVRRRGEWFNASPAFAAAAVRIAAGKPRRGIAPALHRMWVRIRLRMAQ